MMTDEEIDTFLKDSKFKFAKTMSRIPHAWICRKDFVDSRFLQAMDMIARKGYKEKFWSKTYTYYKLGDYKYWVMTDKSGYHDPTAIINRAKI